MALPCGRAAARRSASRAGPAGSRWCFDTLAGEVVTEIPAAPSRHFSGHGLFVQGGDLLLATENDEAKHEGVIGIYDARANYARLGEFPTFGIGPHDLALLPDGKTLVVANGGIDKRHDDTGGVEPADIRSDLVYLDWQSQRLLERVTLEPQYTRLSIRHLALTEAGDVAAALQDSADVPDLDFPLGFLHRPGAAPRWLAAPDGGWGRLRGYCGAAAADRAAGLIAMSSPRGNCVGLWDESGAALEALAIHDGCGLSATGTQGEILISSGSGELFSASRDGPGARVARRQRRVPLRQSHGADLEDFPPCRRWLAALPIERDDAPSPRNSIEPPHLVR